jgi:hypothetical protein
MLDDFLPVEATLLVCQMSCKLCLLGELLELSRDDIRRRKMTGADNPGPEISGALLN